MTANFFPSTGTLVVITDTSDDVAISAVGGQVLINGGDPLTGPLAAAQVQAINVTGGQGANDIDLSAVQSADFTALTTIEVAGNDGNDVITASPVTGSYHGGHGDDVLNGSSADDTLDGDDGHDTINGLDGDDSLIGEDGNDVIDGGSGSDTIDAGDGADSVDGGDDNDNISGGDDQDTLNGGAGDDTINGGFSDDVLNGGDGADRIWGGAGHDVIDGGMGNDTLLGQAGHDTLAGGGQADLIEGGTGNDLVTSADNPSMVSIAMMSTVTEGDAGTTDAMVAVTLAQASGTTITVDFATSDGTAVAGQDYTATSGTLTFAPGITSQFITVPIVGDTNIESDENFFIDLSNAVNAVIVNPQADVTIVDNDGGSMIGDVLVISDTNELTGLETFLMMDGHTVMSITNEFGSGSPNLQNLTFLQGFDMVIWGASGSGFGDIQQPGVYSTLEMYIQSGGNLVATGYDTLASPTDPQMANLVRSIGTQDVFPSGLFTTSSLDHFALNGVLGDFRNMNIQLPFQDWDGSLADMSQGTVSLGTFQAGGTFDAIIYTDIPGIGGSVGYWSGGQPGSAPTDGRPDWKTPGPSLDILRNWVFGIAGGQQLESALTSAEIFELVNLGGPNDDTLLGDEGADTLIGDFADDSLDGGDGNDSMDGGAGNDILRGGADEDSMFGNDGDDDLDGNAGNDTILGGLGADTVVGGVGDDMLFADIPAVSIVDAVLIDPEGDDGEVQDALFTVSLSRTALAPITVDFATANGTATAGMDYNALSGTLTFLPGEQFKTIAIPVLGDILDESNEDFTVTLTNPVGARLANDVAVGTIVDDDVSGIRIQDVTVSEQSVGDLVMVVDVSGSTIFPFGGTPVGDVNNDGSANDVLDAELAGFIALNDQLIMDGVGNVVNTAMVVFGDNGVQVDMNPATPPTPVVVPSATPLADTNSNMTPDVEDMLRMVTQGFAGGGFGTDFEVALQATIGAFNSMGTPPGRGTMVFLSDGSGSGAFQDEVTTLNNMGFTLRAFGVGTGAQLFQLQQIDPMAQIFTTTDELLMALGGISVATSAVNVDITLDTPNVNTVTVDFATSNGSAMDGFDYTATSGTVVFNPGETVQTISIPILGDDIPEPTETFFINLSNAANAPIVDGTALITIEDDDSGNLEQPGERKSRPALIHTELANLGGPEDDLLIGGEGNDTLVSSFGDDTHFGNEGDDSLQGGTGNDQLNGNAGRDTICGGEGDDSLDGGSGADTLKGEAGNDTIRWDYGDGNDAADGGFGTDVLEFVTRTHNDRITVDAVGDGRFRVHHRIPSDLVGEQVIGGMIEELVIDSNGGADRITIDDLTGVAWLNLVTVDAGRGSDLVDASGQANPGILVSVLGGAGQDTIIGGAAGDIIDGQEGNDQLTGGPGADTINGSDGVDKIFGSDGNDILNGGGGRDFVRGENGNDTLSGGDQDDDLYGGEGNDVLSGDAGDDQLFGETGNDTADGGDGADTVSGDDGDDLLLGSAGQDSLRGGAGNDTAQGGSDGDTIVGGTGNDLLQGGNGSIVLLDDGDDFINGNAGNDTILGERGNDTLLGGAGLDEMDGGFGNDQVNGNAGNDSMRGGEGNDLMRGGMGNDTLNGGDGEDSLFGQGGNDGLSGHDGHDRINGGGGADTLHGGDGNDTLRGGAGIDLLIGHDGNDNLNGQGGDPDTLVGEDAFDILDDNGGLDEVDNDFVFVADWINAA